MKSKMTMNQTAHDILKEFAQDNKLFVASHPKEWFEQFEKSQNPRVTLVTCSDSRVQLEAFDKSAQNDTFVIRNIGNQILLNHGSVFYGIEFLKTPVLIIMGHSGCGAVEAAMGDINVFNPALRIELKDLHIEKNSSLKDAVIQNVHNQVQKALDRFKDRMQSGQLTILGMIYDFKNDYGQGYGKIMLININGEIETSALKW